MNGGYSLINCSGLALDAESKQTKAGIYAAIKKAYEDNKPAYACNMTFASAPMTPAAVLITHVGTNYIGTSCTCQIIVDPDDGVTVNNLAPEN